MGVRVCPDYASGILHRMYSSKKIYTFCKSAPRGCFRFFFGLTAIADISSEALW